MVVLRLLQKQKSLFLTQPLTIFYILKDLMNVFFLFSFKKLVFHTQFRVAYMSHFILYFFSVFKKYYVNLIHSLSQLNSTGTSGRSFYPIFNKWFGRLETLLTMCRPKKVLPAGSLCRSLVPNSQSKCPVMTFMLPQSYHALVSNMLSKPLKCFM